MTTELTKKSGRLRANTVPVPQIDPATRDAMWGVFHMYYAAVTRERFDADLDEKNDVIVLRDTGDNSVQGFSTIKVYRETIDGKTCAAVYTGDTILHKEYWGQIALQKAFFLYLLKTKMKHPFMPVYWFLISKGYKTYLLMARAFPTFYPTHKGETPEYTQRVLDTLATRKFGESFDAQAGLVRFPECLGKLKHEVAPISIGELADPDIAFFEKKNPRHADGDELCCIGVIEVSLVFFYTYKLLRKWATRLGFASPRLKSAPQEQ
jgi:hypothetical protein